MKLKLNGNYRLLRQTFFKLGIALAFFGILSEVYAAESASKITSQPPVVDDNNPYVELYRLRVAQAELNSERQQAIEILANARLERGKKLIAQAVIAREEYDVMISEAGVATADVKLAQKKVSEAKAYLRIIEALVKRGVSIPLCTYEME